MGQDDAQAGKAVEHAREDQRADAQRRVEGVLRDLRPARTSRSAASAWPGPGWMKTGASSATAACQNSSRSISPRLTPSTFEAMTRPAAPSCFMANSASRAAAAASGSGTEANSAKRWGCLRQSSAEHFVHQPMPARRDVARQAIGENVRPHRQHLAGDALAPPCRRAALDRLDQLLQRTGGPSAHSRNACAHCGGVLTSESPNPFARSSSVAMMRWGT